MHPQLATFYTLACVGLAVIAGNGCATHPSRSTTDAAASLANETSVRPGINDDFTRPDAALDRWLKAFEGESREIYAHRDAIVSAVNLRRGQSVADIGAGTGLFTALFAQQVGPQGQVHAVDIAPVFLAHIRRRATEANLPQVTTVLATPRSCELPAASVDVAFICDTYHHFEYPRSTLASLHQALRRGGELVLIDFKRVPGQSSDWVMNHVRAGQDVFSAEIEAAGFRKVTEYPILKDNYVVRFRKVNTRRSTP